MPPDPPPIRLPPMLAPARDAAWKLAPGIGALSRVETPAGPCAAAALHVGALVRAADGAWRMVRRATRWPCPAGEMLVIAAGALADCVPGRDLRLSRGQALLLEGGAWPAAFLEDGAGVARVAGAGDLVRVETDAPCAITVEGVACANVAPPGRPVPNAALVRVRRAIAARAGRKLGLLEGAGDVVGGGVVEGWVRDSLRPDAPVLVALRVDGVEVAFDFADRARPDLEVAGLGACAFRFDVALPARGAHLLEACRAEDGEAVPGATALLVGKAGTADAAAPPEAVAGALAALSRARLRRGPAAPR